MKKIIGVLIGLIFIVGAAGYVWYQSSYGGQSYYVKIVEDGEKEDIKSDTGEKFALYHYKQTAYNENGKSKVIKYTADHNLRHDAYLKLTYNNVKGVTNWQEVKSKDLPQKAAEQLVKE